MKLILNDCLLALKEMPDNSVDSVVTDPPYGLSFMGKAWDYDVPKVEVWSEVLRVLKPGGYLLSFAGSRTYHRMAVNIEDAGFEIRDMIEWVYGSGFPKSLNIGKAYDKKMGNEREVVGMKLGAERLLNQTNNGKRDGGETWGNESGRNAYLNKGSSPYEGWGTALKPAHEPIVMARKPLIGTVVENVMVYGTGGINIDESRVPGAKPDTTRGAGGQHGITSPRNAQGRIVDDGLGRFPANLIHDGSDEVLEVFQQTKASKKRPPTGKALFATSGRAVEWNNNSVMDTTERGVEDNGGSAARFFYCAKASTRQRWSYLHCNCETVKLESWQKQDQNQKEQTDGTSQNQDTLEKVLKDDLSSSTSTNGKKRTEKSQKDTASTTLTETSSTTTSPTSSLLLQQNIKESTRDANSEETNGGSPAESAKNSNQSTKKTGTSPKRDGHSTGVVVPATSAKLYRTSVCVDCGSKIEIEGHPTQKPIALMQYLVRLVTPPNGTVLDPFMGSGTTGIACKTLGFDFIGIEMSQEYMTIAQARIELIK